MKYNSLNALKNAEIKPELKIFLMQKFKKITAEYALRDISGVFSVIILAENEADYFADKLLEFSEILTFDNIKYIHTVWAASDGYSEDIYIPFSAENMKVIESRCG